MKETKDLAIPDTRITFICTVHNAGRSKSNEPDNISKYMSLPTIGYACYIGKQDLQSNIGRRACNKRTLESIIEREQKHEHRTRRD